MTDRNEHSSTESDTQIHDTAESIDIDEYYDHINQYVLNQFNLNDHDLNHSKQQHQNPEINDDLSDYDQDRTPSPIAFDRYQLKANNSRSTSCPTHANTNFDYENLIRNLRMNILMLQTKNEVLTQRIFDVTNNFKALQSENEKLRLIISYTETSSSEELSRQISLTESELRQNELSEELSDARDGIKQKDDEIQLLSNKITNLQKLHSKKLIEIHKQYQHELDLSHEQIHKYKHDIITCTETIDALLQEKEDLNERLAEEQNLSSMNLQSISMTAMNRNKTTVVSNPEFCGLLDEIGQIGDINSMLRQESQESQRSVRSVKSKCEIRIFDQRLHEEIAKKEKEFEGERIMYEERISEYEFQLEQLRRNKSGESKGTLLVMVEPRPNIDVGLEQDNNNNNIDRDEDRESVDLVMDLNPKPKNKIDDNKKEKIKCEYNENDCNNTIQCYYSDSIES